MPKGEARFIENVRKRASDELWRGKEEDDDGSDREIGRARNTSASTGAEIGGARRKGGGEGPSEETQDAV